MVENPWKDLPIEGEYVLPADKDKIGAYNKHLPSDSSFKIITDQLPGPYMRESS
jgi:hypothetical protein